MYFAVLWKNKVFSKYELGLLAPQNLSYINSWIVIFETRYSRNLPKLGGIIKYWKIAEKEKIKSFINKELLGTNDSELATTFKNQKQIRRYKLTTFENTDLEVKNKGTEVLNLWKDLFWIVEWYQNIDLYNCIDYQKPVRWANVGMMPAKLANIMINMWLVNLTSTSSVNIYDPFVGFGTTGFLANYFGYNFVGSDINITSLKQNFSFWQTTEFYNPDAKFTYFKHNVKDTFKKSFLKNINLIITEGYLGKKVSRKTKENEIINAWNEVVEIYCKFFENVFNFYENIVVVMTFPYYLTFWNNFVESRLTQFLSTYNVDIKVPEEVYYRKNQSVGRKILIVKK